MVVSNKFSIDYMSLSNGLHTFDFEVNDALFAEMESNEIKGGDCKVHACVNCSDAKLDVNVVISGSVVVECDRCLDDCNIPVEFSGVLTVRFSDLQHDYDGDVMWIAARLRWRCDVDCKGRSTFVEAVYLREHRNLVALSPSTRGGRLQPRDGSTIYGSR